jgi:hypothetical protein
MPLLVRHLNSLFLLSHMAVRLQICKVLWAQEVFHQNRKLNYGGKKLSIHKFGIRLIQLIRYPLIQLRRLLLMLCLSQCCRRKYPSIWQYIPLCSIHLHLASTHRFRLASKCLRLDRIHLQ